MKLVYFCGYTTGPGNYFENPAKLKVGKLYQIEQYSTWCTYRYNGGGQGAVKNNVVRVFDAAGKKVISESEWPSIFRDKIQKNCKHKEAAYLNRTSKILQCQNCFRKFKIAMNLHMVDK